MKLSTHVFQKQTDAGINILTIDNQTASVEISLFGGQVLSYLPKHDSRQRLWLSPKAVLDGSKAIRGGVPICWPWFGQAKTTGLPAHGYLRSQPWHVVRIDDELEKTTLQLQPHDTHGAGFDGIASVLLEVEVSERLSIRLITSNQGDKPFTYCAALHSYFAVSHIENVRLNGLKGQYLDKTQGFSAFPTPTSYAIEGEVDRVHLFASPEVELKDGKNTTRIGSLGHDSVVVWNPGIDKTKDITDMEPMGFQQMLCVETAITQGKTLEVGEEHQLIQIIG
ncbi:D-hexose-6-phosphate mutarotase [Aliiglaciecola sp. CAU 1673]|uniref:D-hexose-6-phosphate mutarotase n=1 Tax=Aliiglaciecola sp. CAU 1673 TaxID=3032595 RepID=UPI0023DC8C52|nr:D-hexose-6-phosphate mutarotase [Aliiglaciecola sp. CAU 1673]MDF2178763.1 D-hexose-6-phosphate mutarotase [Aliiglaciecola sp. CAU 1673]